MFLLRHGQWRGNDWLDRCVCVCLYWTRRHELPNNIGEHNVQSSWRLPWVAHEKLVSIRRFAGLSSWQFPWLFRLFFVAAFFVFFRSCFLCCCLFFIGFFCSLWFPLRLLDFPLLFLGFSGFLYFSVAFCCRSMVLFFNLFAFRPFLCFCIAFLCFHNFSIGSLRFFLLMIQLNIGPDFEPLVAIKKENS